jgi:hypothetical protein
MKRADKIALLKNVLMGKVNSQKQLGVAMPKPLVVRFMRRHGEVFEVTF